MNLKEAHDGIQIPGESILFKSRPEAKWFQFLNTRNPETIRKQDCLCPVWFFQIERPKGKPFWIPSENKSGYKMVEPNW